MGFQSHCGAIGAPVALPADCGAEDFQSHCGAIGARVPADTIEVSRLRAFNPTVVRLGLPHYWSLLIRLDHFQSHCGAIGA